MRHFIIRFGLVLLCVSTLLCACTPAGDSTDTQAPTETDQPTEAETETETEAETESVIETESETEPQTEAETATETETEPETQTQTESEQATTQPEEQTTEGETEMIINTATVYPISYDGIEEVANLKQFIKEVDYDDGNHNNEAHDTGVIISPYFTLKINGQDVPCYSVRTSRGAHSFAMLDATDESFPLSVQISDNSEAEDYKVLPLHYGVRATVKGQSVTAELEAFGNYTFVPDENIKHALTVFVRAKQEYVAPEGYEVIRVAPGKHNQPLKFTAEKQVMYFESGVHEMPYALMFKSNTEVYFEPGAHIMATMPSASVERPIKNPDWAGMTGWCALFQGQYVKNVRISGRGFIDLTKLDWHARSVIQFDQCENITVEGVTLNNSPEWTMFFTQSKNISVNEVMLFGYRQNSDGIAVVDSANAHILNCFARSGDDLFEVKSMYPYCNIAIENIVFENCNGWPDKCRGMGLIAESQRDMTDIHFINCSIGYAPAEWMDDLGAVIIYLEGRSKVTNVSFEGVEVYSSVKYPISVKLSENSTAQIDGITFKDVNIHCDGIILLQNRSTLGGTMDNISFIDCIRGGKICNSKRTLNIEVDGVSKSILDYGEEE